MINRRLVAGYAILLCVTFAPAEAGEAGGEAFAAGVIHDEGRSPFILTALVDRSLPASGPIPIELTLTYVGKDPITIRAFYSPAFSPIQVAGPAEWTPREPQRYATGRIPTQTLAHGHEAKRTVYLQNYFSDLTEGRHQIAISALLWRHDAQPSEAFTAKRHLTIQLLSESEVEHRKRLARALADFQDANPAARARTVSRYLSVHDAASTELLFQGLLDDNLAHLHAEIRAKLISLTSDRDSSEARSIAIQWLARHGGRHDAGFFDAWSKSRIEFTAQEASRLGSAESAWIRLFFLDVVPTRVGYQPMLQSLQEESDALAERVERIRQRYNADQ